MKTVTIFRAIGLATALLVSTHSLAEDEFSQRNVLNHIGHAVAIQANCPAYQVRTLALKLLSITSHPMIDMNQTDQQAIMRAGVAYVLEMGQSLCTAGWNAYGDNGAGKFAGLLERR